MSHAVERLMSEAMRLADAERGDIAARLIDSLDAAADDDAEAAWAVEIQRRVEELRSGQVASIPWSEARRMIADDTDGADAD